MQRLAPFQVRIASTSRSMLPGYITSSPPITTVRTTWYIINSELHIFICHQPTQANSIQKSIQKCDPNAKPRPFTVVRILYAMPRHLAIRERPSIQSQTPNAIRRRGMLVPCTMMLPFPVLGRLLFQLPHHILQFFLIILPPRQRGFSPGITAFVIPAEFDSAVRTPRATSGTGAGGGGRIRVGAVGGHSTRAVIRRFRKASGGGY